MCNFWLGLSLLPDLILLLFQYMIHYLMLEWIGRFSNELYFSSDNFMELNIFDKSLHPCHNMHDMVLSHMNLTMIAHDNNFRILNM